MSRRTVTMRDVERMVPRCRQVALHHRHGLVDPALSVDDLTQIAMVGVLKAARKWDGVGEFSGWATAQADFEIRRVLSRQYGARPDRGIRRAAVASLDAPLGDDTTATVIDLRPAPVEDIDARIVLRQALDQLPSHDRAVLLLNVVAGLSQSEIAGGRNGTPAQTRVSHARRRAMRHARNGGPRRMTDAEKQDCQAVMAWAGEMHRMLVEGDLDVISITRGPISILVSRDGAKLLHRDYGPHDLELIPEPPVGGGDA